MSKTIYSEVYNPNGNLLFTIDQLNNAKIDDKELMVRCLRCGQIFYISKRQYWSFLKGHIKLKYCSSQCSKAPKSPKVTKPCLNCGKMVTKYAKEAERHPNFFCCKSCAASYNNRKRIYTHKAHSKSAKKRKRICTVCGQHVCDRPEVCKGNWLRSQQSISRIKSIGFDITTIGSQRVYDEYDRFRNYIKQLYDRSLSMSDLAKLWKIPNSLTITLLFRWLGIQPRSIQEQRRLTLLYKRDRCTIKSTNYHYQHGWHTTWDNDNVYYRSSYELDYCQILDQHQIKYLMENFKIPYFDSMQHKQRIAIPDFYLPESNTIIEVKSKHTYNRQNMIDKMNAYKELGYRFKLVLEHKEYDYCP